MLVTNSTTISREEKNVCNLYVVLIPFAIIFAVLIAHPVHSQCRSIIRKIKRKLTLPLSTIKPVEKAKVSVIKIKSFLL